MKRFFIIILATFFIGCSLALTFKVNISNSHIEESIIIEKPFLVVLKNLAKKSSFEKIIEQNDANLIEKKWDYLNVEVPRRILRIKDYQLNGVMNFSIEKYDKDLGKLELKFIQNIHLDENLLIIKINLYEQHKNIILYEKNIKVQPIDQKTSKISIKSEIKIKKYIPFFIKNNMNEKVQKNNEKDILNLINNLKKIILN